VEVEPLSDFEIASWPDTDEDNNLPSCRSSPGVWLECAETSRSRPASGPQDALSGAGYRAGREGESETILVSALQSKVQMLSSSCSARWNSKDSCVAGSKARPVERSEGHVSITGLESSTSNLPSCLGTSVMVRNLPLEITHRTLLEELDDSGFGGLYDFAYMPCCFISGKGKGFAFVNLDSDQTAMASGRSWQRSRRFCMRSFDFALNVSAAAKRGWADNVAKWNIPRMRRIRNLNLRPFVRDRPLSSPKPSESQRESGAANVHGEFPGPVQRASLIASVSPPSSPQAYQAMVASSGLVFIPMPR